MKIAGKENKHKEYRVLGNERKNFAEPNHHSRIEVIIERNGIDKIQEACVGKSSSSSVVFDISFVVFIDDEDGIKIPFWSGRK